MEVDGQRVLPTIQVVVVVLDAEGVAGCGGEAARILPQEGKLCLSNSNEHQVLVTCASIIQVELQVVMKINPQ